jgi:hypothetical protein
MSSFYAITTELIEEWFTARNEAPRSRKQHTGLLSALFDHCWRRRYIAENPVDRLEKVHIDREVPNILTLGNAGRRCFGRDGGSLNAWHGSPWRGIIGVY